MTAKLIQALLNPARYAHPVEHCELVETHISWVILTGRFAYKLKKPVNLGFLDFSSLARRRFFCAEELRLNRRLAPELYLSVVPITGTVEHPRLGCEGPAIEYAVKMRQFDQSAQLDRLLAHGELRPHHIDALAQTVSEFHQRIPRAGADSPFGSAEAVQQPVTENFAQIRQSLDEPALLTRLDALQAWSRQQSQRLAPLMAQRKADGFVRECHGDMHLRNMALIDGQVVVFDCIEFNENLRWIDIISEVAFVVMDLQDRQQPGLAQRIVDAWLAHSGDYAGLALLAYYQMYRAMVRAKVNSIRLQQADISASEKQAVYRELDGYLRLAAGYTETKRPCLIITHGLSGSGKTTHSQAILERLGAIRLRSDVERKRLAGLAAQARAGAAAGAGIYTAEMTRRTYARLAQLAQGIIENGYAVIVDATFLQSPYRESFRQLAESLGVPFHLLDFTAPAEVLRQRIRARKHDASDANLAILEKQLEEYQPLTEAEQADCISIDTSTEVDYARIVARLDETRQAD